MQICMLIGTFLPVVIHFSESGLSSRNLFVAGWNSLKFFNAFLFLAFKLENLDFNLKELKNLLLPAVFEFGTFRDTGFEVDLS